MPNPLISIGLGSGQDAWLTIELETVRFKLETENGKKTVESLSIAELKVRLPQTANLVRFSKACSI